jgi:hypothetical protein
MINIQEFLLKSDIKFGTYALVTYDGKVEPTWFTKYNFEDGEWFLESPCELYEVKKIEEPIEKFLYEYASFIVEEFENPQEYIEKYVRHMIIDNILYTIENFQCSPYLPKKVEDIKLISERECLEYMLNKSK